MACLTGQSSFSAVSVQDCMCEREEEREILCLCASQRQTDTPPLVRDRLKAREKRLCLDSERTSSITSSKAREYMFKQHVNGEFLKLG